jgi:hypothetical protein
MPCPYFFSSKRDACKVFSGLYQPRAQEKQKLCLTDDYEQCEIYHFYQTTCVNTPYLAILSDAYEPESESSTKPTAV